MTGILVPMRILQVNTADIGGGAEAVAWQLCQWYRRLGHASWLAVGMKRSQCPEVFQISQDQFRSLWTRLWLRFADGLQSLVGTVRGMGRIGKVCGFVIGQPGRLLARMRGFEDFSFPGTWHINELPLPARPEILHCHNLHGAWLSDGGYFDLSVLPSLSRNVPVVATLHDAWLLSGHCAHSFECERWRTGCGACPDLTIYPAIWRDATALNWKRKQKIYAESRLYVATPSRWLMEKVEQSILYPALVGTRVIPNGVDLSIFCPADRRVAREALGIPQKAKVLLCSAHGVRGNLWKDYLTMRQAIAKAAAMLRGQEVLFIALGEESEWEETGEANVRFVSFQDSRTTVAQYYQAADVYLHAAKAETFSLSILEGLACGIPVIATAVGGIPEQIDEAQTGFLVPISDADAMARRIVQLLTNDELRERFSLDAARVARGRFDIRDQARAYLAWFEEIVGHPGFCDTTTVDSDFEFSDVRVSPLA